MDTNTLLGGFLKVFCTCAGVLNSNIREKDILHKKHYR